MHTFDHDTPEDPITALSQEESWELLGSAGLGRLIVNTNDRIEIFPVNHVTHDGKIVFRTSEGSKLAALTVYPDVVFEVDHIAADCAWSVIVYGTSRQLSTSDEINEADTLPLHSWVPTAKFNYVEIAPTEINGRRMRLEPHD